MQWMGQIMEIPLRYTCLGAVFLFFSSEKRPEQKYMVYPKFAIACAPCGKASTAFSAGNSRVYQESAGWHHFGCGCVYQERCAGVVSGKQ